MPLGYQQRRTGVGFIANRYTAYVHALSPRYDALRKPPGGGYEPAGFGAVAGQDCGDRDPCDCV
ncbi:MAG TPA: hypothetical protein VH722_11890, partial [Alphaproteobacteria bacterium]|nr:hypothetical protein [Alphaproteobacteria bacterium]